MLEEYLKRLSGFRLFNFIFVLKIIHSFFWFVNQTSLVFEAFVGMVFVGKTNYDLFNVFVWKNRIFYRWWTIICRNWRIILNPWLLFVLIFWNICVWYCLICSGRQSMSYLMSSSKKCGNYRNNSKCNCEWNNNFLKMIKDY